MDKDLVWLPYQSWMNAAGTGGFAPDKEFLENFDSLSAFVTNPISLQPRKPSAHRGVYCFEGGFLLHSGWPNPGFYKVLKQYQTRWEHLTIPVIINLLVNDPDETAHMVQLIEGIDNVYAIELSFSSAISGSQIIDNLAAGYGKIPLIANIPMERINETWIQDLHKQPVEAISLQTPRGLMKVNNRYVQGRMFGPGVLPLTMQAVKTVDKLQLPVFAGAGITDTAQIDELFALGLYGFQFFEIGWAGKLA